MKRNEFKDFLKSYKEVLEIVRPIVEKSYPGWDCLYFHISNGKVLATIWSGEDARDIPDALRDVDVTKEVLAELLPSDLIF